MKIYSVYADDYYVERDGSQDKNIFCGTWAKKSDAAKAVRTIRTQTQAAYVRGGRMPAWENIRIEEQEVHEEFKETQVY